MSKKAARMYRDKPTLERGEDGNMGVKKATKADEVDAGTEGVVREDEAMPSHVRHAMARADLHKRQEAEHMVADHHKAGDKKEMHTRHEKELKALHSQHEKEMESGSMEGAKEKTEKEPKAEKTGEKQIEKVESDKE